MQPALRFEGVVGPCPHPTLTLSSQQLDFHSKEAVHLMHTEAVMQFEEMLIRMTRDLDPCGKYALKSKSRYNLKLLSTLTSIQESILTHSLS